MRVCTCCLLDKVKDFILYPDLPEILFPIDREIKNSVKRYDLRLYFCPHCKHVFQLNVDRKMNERIYQQLYKYYPFEGLESFQPVYRKPFDSLFNKVIGEKVNGKNLLEIGCSSLGTMQKFADKGFRCTGVDPVIEDMRKENITVIGDSYEAISFQEQFDVIISRFSLEHIVDIDLFMNKLLSDVKDNGLVFVQVPNITNFIKAGTLCIGAHEHIQYFSPLSLNMLFRRYGFSAVAMADVGEPSLIECFRKNGSNQGEFSYDVSDTVYACFPGDVDRAGESFMASVGDSRKVCFFGAGLQLIWLLYFSGFDFSNKEVAIFDDNKVLNGRYLPEFDVPVREFNHDIMQKSDCLVLSLNSVYYDKVIARLSEVIVKDYPVIMYQQGEWITRIINPAKV